MGYLAFFLFISILSAIPEILNSLVGVDIANISVTATLLFLSMIFLYSLIKGYKHKISYLVFSLIYWLCNIGATYYVLLINNSLAYHILSLLNFTPMSALIIEDDIFTSTLIIILILTITIGIGYLLGYCFRRYVVNVIKDKKRNKVTATLN